MMLGKQGDPIGDPFLFLGWGLGAKIFQTNNFWLTKIAVELLDLLLMATFLDSQFSRSDSGGFAKLPLRQGMAFFGQSSPTHGARVMLGAV